MTKQTETVEQSAADTTQADKQADKQADADFDAGFTTEAAALGPKTPAQADGQQPRDDGGRFVESKPEPKPGKKPEDRAGDKAAPKAADKSADKQTEKPEYIQLTKQQFERLEKAAKITDEVENKFSKAFGTLGDVQKIVRTLQGQTPRGKDVKIPAGAFDAMKKDFPELAEHMQAAMEATLKGMEGTGNPSAQVDVTEFERKVEARVLKLAAEDLEDAYPDWQKIVGAVDTRKGEKPDPNNKFRKWLATKDKSYQDRINGTNSAGVITRAIRAFKSESKTAPAAPAKPNQQAQTRASRIQEAVRPKGDGGQPPAKNADDDFLAGFHNAS